LSLHIIKYLGTGNSNINSYNLLVLVPANWTLVTPKLDKELDSKTGSFWPILLKSISTVQNSRNRTVYIGILHITLSTMIIYCGGNFLLQKCYRRRHYAAQWAQRYYTAQCFHIDQREQSVDGQILHCAIENNFPAISILTRHIKIFYIDIIRSHQINCLLYIWICSMMENFWENMWSLISDANGIKNSPI